MLPVQGSARGGPQDGGEEGARLPAEGHEGGGPQDGGEEGVQLPAEDAGTMGHQEVSLDALSSSFHLARC